MTTRSAFMGTGFGVRRMAFLLIILLAFAGGKAFAAVTVSYNFV